jgi:acyl-CoA synthetase (AMP-forming)/AMP-acid ligase II
VFVEDRLKDMIISGGENIYSLEVERVLAEHPAVLEVAVFGVPDEKWGEAVHATVALAPDSGSADVDADALITWCRERLAHYKCPKAVDLMPELPRNPTGKILKKDLRQPFWAGHSRSTV